MINDYFVQAELALAAYANLTILRPSETALVDAGMSTDQAFNFASKWTVVDQFDSITGVSATVFEENTTGQRYLAIRGTEGLTDYLALAPGMQVAAEIKLADQTVMEYLLSPVRKAFHEAGRER